MAEQHPSVKLTRHGCVATCQHLPPPCQGIYLVADDADAADAWVDALVLCQHLVASQCSAALEEALAPVKRKQHTTGGL
jgi:hypothetical protein